MEKWTKESLQCLSRTIERQENISSEYVEIGEGKNVNGVQNKKKRFYIRCSVKAGN